MSGWCPSSSVCGMAVVCAAAVLPSAVVRLVPRSSRCSAGEYCGRVVYCPLPVCGVWVVGVCLCCSCGGVSSVCSPLVVVGGGCRCGWWVPLWVVGAVVGEGRLCCRPPCLVCGVPLLRVGVPLVVYPVALLNGGVACAVVPCLRIGSGALHCPIPSCIVLFPLVLSSSPSLFVFVVTVLLV